MSKTFNGLELCSGPGGLSEGFMSVKHNNTRFFIAVANDIDKNASLTYTNNHKNTTFVLGSLASKKTKKNIENAIKNTVGLSNLDIVIGGPPCQGFSHANKKTRTATNPLNRIALDFFEMVREVNPFLFVLENVPGMLSMENGKMVERIIQNFQSLGYDNTEYWILDAVEYGVPQKRKRIFIVGSKSPNRIIPPTPTHDNHITVWDALSDLPAIRSGYQKSNSNKYRHAAKNSLQKKLRNKAKNVKNHIVTVNGPVTIKKIQCVPRGGNWRDVPKEIMSAKGQYKNMNNIHSGIYKRLPASKPSVTITNFRKSMLIHPTQNRLLSIREAARLQTFPDAFEFYGPLSSMQQQVSDAVPINLAKAVAKALLYHMEQSLYDNMNSKLKSD